MSRARISPSSKERARAETLTALEHEFPTLVATADFNGLLRLQALAQVVAQNGEGDVRRRAARIAKRAGTAADKARQLDAGSSAAPAEVAANGGHPHGGVNGSSRAGEVNGHDRLQELPASTRDFAERNHVGNGASAAPSWKARRGPTKTELDRSLLARAAMSTNLDAPAAREGAGLRAAEVNAEGRLLIARLTTLLKILARDESREDIAPVAMRELIVRKAGAVDVVLPAALGPYRHLLLEGYERARVLPGKLVFGLLRHQHRRQIRRDLKQIAVDSLSSGTDVRGLADGRGPGGRLRPADRQVADHRRGGHTRGGRALQRPLSRRLPRCSRSGRRAARVPRPLQAGCCSRGGRQVRGPALDRRASGCRRAAVPDHPEVAGRGARSGGRCVCRRPCRLSDRDGRHPQRLREAGGRAGDDDRRENDDRHPDRDDHATDRSKGGRPGRRPSSATAWQARRGSSSPRSRPSRSRRGGSVTRRPPPSSRLRRSCERRTWSRQGARALLRLPVPSR